MTAGSISVHIRALDADDHFDVETPAGVISLLEIDNLARTRA